MDNTLGKLVDSEQERDAIHVAIATLLATDDLLPGEHIGVVRGTMVAKRDSATPIGIVDPFLKQPVKPGQRFRVLLYPNSITSLKHNWSHPAFDTSGAFVAAEHRMRALAEACHVDYHEFLEAGDEWLSTYQPGVQWSGSSFAPSDQNMTARDVMDDPDNMKDYWECYEILTGHTAPTGEDREECIFSCSC